MRQIKRIFVHCTAGAQHQSIDDLKAEFRRKGWKQPGYHYVVDAHGGVHQLLSVEQVSNGVQGYNQTAINVAYMGGIDSQGKPTDNRTLPQKEALALLLHRLKQQFYSAKIMGHRDIWGTDPRKWKKQCPCFNATDEYKDIE